MALTRSERKCDLVLDRTPASVAPGSYLGIAAYTVPKSKAPFSTTGKRHDLVNIELVPGPSDYNVPMESTVTWGNGMLASRTKRSDPCGSSTSLETPGPGNYNIATSWKPQMVRSSSSSCVITPSRTTPTIPTKSYGYVEKEDGSLKEMKPPAVGYVVHTETTNGKITKFGMSKSKRLPYGPNLEKLAAIPGPGAYRIASDYQKKKNVEVKRQSIKRELAKVSTNEIENRSIVLSRNASLGGIRKESSMKKTSQVENRPKSSIGFSSNSSLEQSIMKNSAFGTTEIRENSIMKNSDTPYLTPSSVSTPGPGTYQQTKATCWFRWQIEQQKKRDQNQIGFSSTANRPILQFKPLEAPPPRLIIKETNQTIPPKNEQVRKPFGSSTKKVSIFETKSAQWPGPGHYEYSAKGEQQKLKEYRDEAIEAIQLQQILQQDSMTMPEIPELPAPKPLSHPRPSSSFASQTQRFESSSEDLAAESCSYEDKVSSEIQVPISNSKSFGSTSKRFSKSLASTPGPGQYNTINTFIASDRSVVSSAMRFQPGQSVYNKPVSLEAGPGAYQVATSLNKKSFNVSVPNETRNIQKVLPLDQSSLFQSLFL